MSDERVSILKSDGISSNRDSPYYDLGMHLPSPSPKIRVKKILKMSNIKVKKGLSKMMKKSTNESGVSIKCENESIEEKGTSPQENDNSSPWSNILSFVMCEGSMSQIFDRTYTNKIPVPSYRNETDLWKDSSLLQEYKDREKGISKQSVYSEEGNGDCDQKNHIQNIDIDQKTKTRRRRSCMGPKLGSFTHKASEKNGLHEEVLDTYTNFRADELSTSIFKQIKCSVPLYHNHSEMEVRKDIKHSCSEPLASSFEVRGSSYLMDSKKEPSDETMFSLLGVDNVVKKKGDQSYREDDVCRSPNSYFERLKFTTTQMGIDMPFILVINFVVPWGNLLAYFYRPDSGDGGPINHDRIPIPSEKLWNDFLNGDETFRNNTLKFIPKVIVGPWAIKKLVGIQPAMIGQKIPTTYFGSKEDGYLEINMNVTKGGKFANAICSRVASAASIVSIDLAFLLQGNSEKELPEQLLSVIRLHHVQLKLC